MERAEAIAEREYRRSEAPLTNILPPTIAARLKGSTSEIADAYPEASILFADMAGFTARASDTSPEDLVHFLNSVYTRIDNIVERHGLEKIKTSGDAYMVVSGVPEALPDHACARSTGGHRIGCLPPFDWDWPVSLVGTKLWDVLTMVATPGELGHDACSDGTDSTGAFAIPGSSRPR
jgi:class 3 adenylate cyclase